MVGYGPILYIKLKLSHMWSHTHMLRNTKLVVDYKEIDGDNNSSRNLNLGPLVEHTFDTTLVCQIS